MDINSASPVITRDEILIRAPIETVWDIQTNVDDGPRGSRTSTAPSSTVTSEFPQVTSGR